MVKDVGWYDFYFCKILLNLSTFPYNIKKNASNIDERFRIHKIQYCMNNNVEYDHCIAHNAVWSCSWPNSMTNKNVAPFWFIFASS